MVRWNELTTKKGGRIVFIFENEKESKPIIDKLYTHRKFQKDSRKKIQDLKIDPGKGGNVHVLMNSEGIAKFADKSDYDAWLTQENKDWFHRKMPSILGEIMEKIMIASVLSEIFGGDLDLDDLDDLDDHDSTDDSTKSEFSGATEEEHKEAIATLVENPELFAEIAKNHKCFICPSKYCGNREASFDMSRFREELKK